MAKADVLELRQRLQQMKTTRTPIEPLYRDLQRYILPESGRFDVLAAETDEYGYEHILDATATDALDTLGAGMLGGMTSPARPWFRLTTRRPELDENDAVTSYLADVQREMLMVFAHSNVYQALNNCYLELACYGTACLVALPSSRDIIHLHECTCGEYWIEEDGERKVDTVYRRIEMTARQMVDTFGEENCSVHVRDCANDPSKCFQRFTVVQAIEPRPVRDRAKKGAQDMPYRSVYFEAWDSSSTGYTETFLDDRNQDRRKVLREEGFLSFPCMVPRWTLSKQSPYGRSPGMKAIGVVKALQEESALKDRAVDYAVNPPILVPQEYETRPLDFGPGGVVYVNPEAMTQVKPAFDVVLQIEHTMQDIADKRQQINEYFFKDLFLMLAQSARYDRTAFEVEQLQKEKMLIMGPVLERLHAELHEPLIRLTLQYMQKFGRLPKMPDELEQYTLELKERRYRETGIDEKPEAKDILNIEYVSILSQAQRAAGVDSMNRFVSALGGMSQLWPNVVDLLDEDKWARNLADQLGVDPEVVRSQDECETLREQRAQQRQAEQQLQVAQQAADIGKSLPTAADATAAMSSYGAF